MMKEKIRALIVDDEQLSRERVRDSLSADPEIEIIGECADGREAIAAIQTQSPDLLFLDVRMPRIDGFSVLEAIEKEKMPLVIFVTSYDKYAVRAFKVHAVDYLLKPYTEELFREAVEEAKKRLGPKHSGEMIARILNLLEEHKSRPGAETGLSYLERLTFNKDGRVFLIKVADIDWIEAQDHYIRIHTGKERYLLHEALSNLEAQLNPEQFPRIHRSHIINIDRIREIKPLGHHECRVILFDGTDLKVSRTGIERLEKILRHKL